jgi:hypothetical protein
MGISFEGTFKAWEYKTPSNSIAFVDTIGMLIT